jgi:hypothetical protein
MKTILATIVLVWLRDLFGKGTPEHTTLAPHHTDACYECVIYTTTESSLCMSLARHKQQADRALERMSAIRELEMQLEELSESRRLHRAESYAAQVEYSQATSGAYHEYDELCRMFSTVRQLGEAMDLGNAMASAVVRDFIRAAKGFSFCLSTDYQMDKPIPTWGRSPQPGPTYFKSKLTNYVHIICAESCGASNGPSRFARNQVNIRSESIGGSKNSNDTIATVFDYLLVRLEPLCTQPEAIFLDSDSGASQSLAGCLR